MALEEEHELGSAVDLDSSDVEGGADDELVEQGSCGAGGCGAGDVADRPFGDRVGGGEVLDRLVWTDVDEEGVDLDEFAGCPGFSALGETLRVALMGIEAEAPATRPARAAGSARERRRRAPSAAAGCARLSRR
jgi:hypothetical protein